MIDEKVSAHAQHGDDEMHHHHSHSDSSRHPGHHHLLSVEHLSVSFRMYDEAEPYFSARQRLVPVIDDLSISVHEGEIVAIVGASGSGKTILADSIMGLFEPNAQVEGDVYFDGKPVGAAELQALRGHGISLVPQSVSYLNPLIRVGRQVEGFARHVMSAADRRRKREHLFAHYGLEPKVAKLYPFELSGGMARRVLLSCALMDDPKLIIADEPTPGLDLPLAVRALQDFRDFADQGGGVMLITHDIELALSVADRIAVFCEGTVVEETAVANFSSPDLLRHPFSRALWYALPEHTFTVTEGEISSNSATQEAIYEAECTKGNEL